MVNPSHVERSLSIPKNDLFGRGHFRRGFLQPFLRAVESVVSEGPFLVWLYKNLETSSNSSQASVKKDAYFSALNIITHSLEMF